MLWLNDEGGPEGSGRLLDQGDAGAEGKLRVQPAGYEQLLPAFCPTLIRTAFRGYQPWCKEELQVKPLLSELKSKTWKA